MTVILFLLPCAQELPNGPSSWRPRQCYFSYEATPKGWLVLIQKRSNFVVHGKGFWGLPGGKATAAEDELAHLSPACRREAQRLTALREVSEECGGGQPRYSCNLLQIDGKCRSSFVDASLPPGVANHTKPGCTLEHLSERTLLYVLDGFGADKALFQPNGNGQLLWLPRAKFHHRGEIEEGEPGTDYGYLWVPIENLQKNNDFQEGCSPVPGSGASMWWIVSMLDPTKLVSTASAIHQNNLARANAMSCTWRSPADSGACILWSTQREETEEERRIDPEDGGSYTHEELHNYYKGKYKKKAIEEYWRKSCKKEKARDSARKEKSRNSSKREEVLLSILENRLRHIGLLKFVLARRLLGKCQENFKFISARTGADLVLEDHDEHGDWEPPCPTHIRVLGAQGAGDLMAATSMTKELIHSVHDDAERLGYFRQCKAAGTCPISRRRTDGKFLHCCRTCAWSNGEDHGPECQKRHEAAGSASSASVPERQAERKTTWCNAFQHSDVLQGIDILMQTTS